MPSIEVDSSPRNLVSPALELAFGIVLFIISCEFLNYLKWSYVVLMESTVTAFFILLLRTDQATAIPLSSFTGVEHAPEPSSDASTLDDTTLGRYSNAFLLQVVLRSALHQALSIGRLAIYCLSPY
jgi:hypothetical protein